MQLRPWKCFRATDRGPASEGVRGHVRYKPTLLNDEKAGDFCDPFGFCQSTLNQIELAAAVIMRF
jgi:hypothetical protein